MERKGFTVLTVTDWTMEGTGGIEAKCSGLGDPDRQRKRKNADWDKTRTGKRNKGIET